MIHCTPYNCLLKNSPICMSEGNLRTRPPLSYFNCISLTPSFSNFLKENFGNPEALLNILDSRSAQARSRMTTGVCNWCNSVYGRLNFPRAASEISRQ